MIAHMSYVMCDGCGNPAAMADDAIEARDMARDEGFIRRRFPGRGRLDLCRDCQRRPGAFFVITDKLPGDELPLRGQAPNSESEDR